MTLRGPAWMLITLLLAACSRDPGPAVPTPAASASKPSGHADVAWERPQGANLDAVFAKARELKKPVFLYWGAVWCPPCNQVKRTVFQRADFVARSQSFVPVYVDGDAAGAQQIGERFQVRGYPTMIVMQPDQTEIARLPGEVDAARYLEALDLALNASQPVRALLQLATAGAADAQTLDTAAWQRLAYYAWEQDAAQVLPAHGRSRVLWQLGMACPAAQTARCLRLLTRALSLSGQDHAVASPQQLNRVASGLREVLNGRSDAREVLDLLSNDVETLFPVLARLSPTDRRAVESAWAQSLLDASQNTAVAPLDRLSALSGFANLRKLQAAPGTQIPAQDRTLVQDRLRVLVSAGDDPQERQALVPGAADLLAELGLLDESDALLQAELPRALAPYYHMLMLSSNARKRGQPQVALDWAERAWKASVGPATRLQWGTSYVTRLVDLAPQDGERVRTAVRGVLMDVEPVPENFVHRNAKQLQRLSDAVHRWSAAPGHAAALHPLRAEWDARCNRLSAQEAAAKICRSVFARLPA